MSEVSASLLNDLRQEHRRLLNLFRPLEQCQDDFERIERASTICEETRQLLTSDRYVVYPLLEHAADAEARPRTSAARMRQAQVLSLVERLEALSPEEADFDILARQTYDALREYVCSYERELSPLFSSVSAKALQDADHRRRDMRERLA